MIYKEALNRVYAAVEEDILSMVPVEEDILSMVPMEADTPDEIQRPAQNDTKFAGSAFPITEDFARSVYKRSDFSYDADIGRPMTSTGIREALEKQILPAMKHLRFMGINPMPEVHIIAPWSTTDNEDIQDIRYTEYVPLESLFSDEIDDLVETAMTNAGEGELPGTLGHVTLNAFAESLSTFLSMVGRSTTAHRRFKNAFPCRQVVLIFHAERNHVEMFLPFDVLKAFDDSVKAFLNGR